MAIRIPPFEYPKVRNQFGHAPDFGDTKHPEQVQSIARDPNYDHKGRWFNLIEQTLELSCIPPVARHTVSTRTFTTNSKASKHTHGAWPVELKNMERQDRDKKRNAKKKKDNENYSIGVPELSRKAEDVIRQNNVIDLYEKYFDSEDPGVVVEEPPSTKTAAVLRDPEGEVPREANCISWHPDQANKLAVAYSSLQFQNGRTGMKATSYIWDLNTPNSPDYALTPQSPLVSLEYNPKKQEEICGGSYNGLITFWDLRQDKPYLTLDKAHHDPVYDIRWIQARGGNECVSVSTDGRLLWWDMRKPKQNGYTDELVLEEKGTRYGGMSLGYKAEAGGTKYLVGTEQGYVLSCDRKPKKMGATSQKSFKVFGSVGSKHLGPINTIERNSLHHKMFLTVGDWTARVWGEDTMKTPIMTTRYDGSYLTSGCWSPTRAGVFFTTKADGSFDIWDLYHKQNAPTYTSKLGDLPLRSIKLERSGSLVAMGAQDGTVSVLHLNQGLWDGNKKERDDIGAMFERESKREKNLADKAKQKNREAREANKTPPPVFDPFAEESEEMKKKLASVEEEFYKKLDLTRDSVPKLPEVKAVGGSSDSDDEEELFAEGAMCTLRTTAGGFVQITPEGPVNALARATDPTVQFTVKRSTFERTVRVPRRRRGGHGGHGGHGHGHGHGHGGGGHGEKKAEASDDEKQQDEKQQDEKELDTKEPEVAEEEEEKEATRVVTRKVISFQSVAVPTKFLAISDGKIVAADAENENILFAIRKMPGNAGEEMRYAFKNINRSRGGRNMPFLCFGGDGMPANPLPMRKKAGLHDVRLTVTPVDSNAPAEE
jgi:dynein intermediate chain 2